MLDLVDRIAPIQSQVPRAPFATIAVRLPGTAYADLVDLFESHRLVKASTLRGTVFTSGREQFGWSQRIAREGRVEFLAAQTKVASGGGARPAGRDRGTRRRSGGPGTTCWTTPAA